MSKSSSRVKSVILGTSRNVTKKTLHGRMEEKTCWIESHQKLHRIKYVFFKKPVFQGRLNVS